MRNFPTYRNRFVRIWSGTSSVTIRKLPVQPICKFMSEHVVILPVRQKVWLSVQCQHLAGGTWPWRHRQQSTVSVGAGSYYQLWQLQPIARSMLSDALMMLVQALISCHLDYCNSLFYLLQHIWRTGDPAAVCLECCCLSGVGSLMVWPHHTDATSVALASSLETGEL